VSEGTGPSAISAQWEGGRAEAGVSRVQTHSPTLPANSAPGSHVSRNPVPSLRPRRTQGRRAPNNQFAGRLTRALYQSIPSRLQDGSTIHSASRWRSGAPKTPEGLARGKASPSEERLRCGGGAWRGGG